MAFGTAPRRIGSEWYTRSGRKLDNPTSFKVYESLPPPPGVTDWSGGDVVSDAYGQTYVRHKLLGMVPVRSDSSAGMIVPGGVPISLAVRTRLANGGAAEHVQREEMQFYPGEDSRQSFPRKFFNGLCGGCHGSVSGQEIELAAKPDILTQASQVAARDTAPANLAR